MSSCHWSDIAGGAQFDLPSRGQSREVGGRQCEGGLYVCLACATVIAKGTGVAIEGCKCSKARKISVDEDKRCRDEHTQPDVDRAAPASVTCRCPIERGDMLIVAPSIRKEQDISYLKGHSNNAEQKWTVPEGVATEKGPRGPSGGNRVLAPVVMLLAKLGRAVSSMRIAVSMSTLPERRERILTCTHRLHWVQLYIL